MVRLFRRLLLDPVRYEGNRTRKKIENIQGLRGAAILLVVFAHIMAIEQKYGHGSLPAAPAQKSWWSLKGL